MVQQVVQAVIDSLTALGGTLMRLALPIGIFIGFLVVAGILLWASDREGFKAKLSPISRFGANAPRWIALSLFVGVVWLTLQALPVIAGVERAQQLAASYTTREDASTSGVFQYGPIAAYVQERTFTRTLTLPPVFLERIGAEGVQVLSPYLQDPSAENVLRIADTFRRSGQDVVFTREVTRLEEIPISIEKANVDVKMDFKDTGAATRKSFYQADFDATYTFKNPLSTSAKVRFRFPLPETGTIEGLELTVGSAKITEPDEDGAYQWEGELGAGESTSAKVRYHTKGGGSWRYEVGSGRRRIEALTLTVDANEPARFLRGALYPTRRSGSKMTWELGNVITNQQIDLMFPGQGLQVEAQAKALGFLPMALAAFLACAFLVSWRVGKSLEPGSFALAVAGFSVGLGGMVVALQYMPMFPAVILAAALAAWLVVRAIGWTYLPAAGLAAILPLAFASGEHSGLIVVIAAALAFIALAPKATGGSES